MVCNQKHLVSFKATLAIYLMTFLGDRGTGMGTLCTCAELRVLER